MLNCQSSSLNAVFGREVRIQMLKMAVLDRQEGVEKKTPTDSELVEGSKGCLLPSYLFLLSFVRRFF